MVEEHLNTSQDQVAEVKHRDEKILFDEQDEKKESCWERLGCRCCKARQSETDEEEDEDNEGRDKDDEANTAEGDQEQTEEAKIKTQLEAKRAKKRKAQEDLHEIERKKNEED